MIEPRRLLRLTLLLTNAIAALPDGWETVLLHDLISHVSQDVETFAPLRAALLKGRLKLLPLGFPVPKDRFWYNVYISSP